VAESWEINSETCSSFTLSVNLHEEKMQEECRSLVYGELAPSKSGIRQMTNLVLAVKHSYPGGVLPVLVCSHIQCERIVPVPCSTVRETGRTPDLLISHSRRTTRVASMASPDLSC